MSVPVFTPSISNIQAINPPYIAGRWYPTSAQVTTGGAAVATDVVRLYPFTVRNPITLSDLMARVVTVGLGSFQLAIYGHNAATGRPTGAVLARTGDMSTTVATVVSADITGANVALAAGVYWAAANVDVTSATTVFQIPQIANTSATNLVGALTEAIASSGSQATSLSLTTPMAYNTWSSMTSAVFTEVGGASGVAHIFLKAA